MGKSQVPLVSTGELTPEKWRQLTELLRRHEEGLAKLAAEKSLELHASSRWPELSLRRRSLLSISEARVSLDPQSLNETAPKWSVRVVKYPRWPLFGGREGVAREIALLTDDEAKSGKQLIDEMSRAAAALG